jgi:hypothetical protein
MKSANRLLCAASVSALAALGAMPAYAAGTAAGATITNTVAVNFQVGGVSQTAQTASNSVIVDRKVNLTIVNVGSTTSVSPGQTAAVTTFQVTNSSNDTLDLSLAALNQAGGTAAHGGTDVIDVSNFKYYADTNSNGVYDAGTDVQITWLDEVAADATKTVFVVSDVPISATNGQVAGIVLTARAEASGTAGTQGALLTATVGANTAGVDTVFADGAGATDSANDGAYSVKGDYTVAAALLTVTKLSTLISDPVNGTTNPKAIPGAVMEYCIVVANGAGAATSTSLSISDPLPATVTYNAAYGIFLNGTVTAGVCNADGTAGGTYTAGTTTVSGPLANLAASATETLRFRVTIN